MKAIRMLGNAFLCVFLAITFDVRGVGETVPIDSLDNGILNGSMTENKL